MKFTSHNNARGGQNHGSSPETSYKKRGNSINLYEREHPATSSTRLTKYTLKI